MGPFFFFAKFTGDVIGRSKGSSREERMQNGCSRDLEEDAYGYYK
jgi:hypothetical protein